jgi:hypothetical protein
MKAITGALLLLTGAILVSSEMISQAVAALHEHAGGGPHGGGPDWGIGASGLGVVLGLLGLGYLVIDAWQGRTGSAPSHQVLQKPSEPPGDLR